MQQILDEHYKRLAKDYDKYLYYSPRFVRTLTTKVIEKLDLRPSDVFVDLCGGTGMYSADIHAQIEFDRPSYCVDAYKEMLDQIRDTSKIQPLHMDAVAFSGHALEYQKVLVKEAIHHIEDRRGLITALFKRLPPGGRLLLVHVPPELQYPIFERARERAREFHAKPLELMDALQEAGFRLDVDSVDYPHRIDKGHYFDQVRSKFMTALSSFSDVEIEEGLKEMEEKYRAETELEFIDHFDYLTGIKD